jgi:hypothetical protein
MRPEEIGDMLGTDPESVIVAREGALERLAGELGMDDVSELDDVRARLAELPADVWTGAPAPAATRPEPESAARPKLAVAGDEKPVARPARPEPAAKRKSRLPLLLALLAAAAVVLVVVLASSGGDGNSSTNASSTGARASKPPPVKPAPQKPPSKPPAKPHPAPHPRTPATAATGPKVPLAAVGSASGATGTAALGGGGKRLLLDVSGLPNPRGGAYQVWLYNSVVGSVNLVKVGGTKLTLDLKLPSNASHYRYVDISFEPADGNPNHSGQSVLRVPLAKLAR